MGICKKSFKKIVKKIPQIRDKSVLVHMSDNRFASDNTHKAIVTHVNKHQFAIFWGELLASEIQG